MGSAPEGDGDVPVDSILYGGLSVLGCKSHSGCRRWRGGPQARLSPQAGVAEGGRSLLVSRTLETGNWFGHFGVLMGVALANRGVYLGG